MGELVDFVKILKERQLQKGISNLNKVLSSQKIPSPQEFGWRPIDFVDDYAIRYFHERMQAYIGYCQGEANKVYLEYRGDRLKYSMTLEELSLGIETGTLPDSEGI